MQGHRISCCNNVQGKGQVANYLAAPQTRPSKSNGALCWNVPIAKQTSRRCTIPCFMIPCMKPEAANAAQKEIVHRIDDKARAIRDAGSRWNLSAILAEMKFAVTHEGNTDDDRFAEQYAVWRSQHPL